ncbi:MAG: bifunctional aminoglycoside phosphotransferase/ATP-binding protein [Thiobacillaceae bacterium]
MKGLPPLIASLRAALDARVIETHISWVLLAGERAYKIKKPLNLGFLDFSTLKRRRFFCEEEVRLNRRLAPEIYLDVVPITGEVGAACIAGEGPVLEWAVRMRAFPPDATLDREGRLNGAQIDAIADTLARFHATIDPAPPDSPYGGLDAVMYPVRENFRQIRGLHPDPEAVDLLNRIEVWSETEGARLADHFAARKIGGWVRECHGDLHLGNIAWVDDQPLIFDCIEFNPALRFIDVTSEVAFLTMDLLSRGRSDLAWRFLNRWLEYMGDYEGLAALPFYQVYRAMVRAKVDYIRAGQADTAAGRAALGYLHLADRLSQPRRPALLVMHGVSGSGKTHLSQQVLEALGGVRLRSDVERKRLFGLQPLEDSSRIPGGIYTEEASRRTFDRMGELVGMLLRQGHVVIADATFLRRAHRLPMIQAAEAAGVPWRILSLQASVDVLKQRVRRRAQARDDASEASVEVLLKQLDEQESFDTNEALHVLTFDGGDDRDWPTRIVALQRELTV